MDEDTTETVIFPDASLAPSRHVSVWMDVAPEAAYQIASDPTRLPAWAAGLADPSLPDAAVEFAPNNEFGVLDHVVRLPSGEQFYNPMRVIPAGFDTPRCEVVFTVRRHPGMTDAQFESDVAAVTADLETLKRLVEG